MYESVSQAMYQVFFEEEAAEVVQPVSCDEAYIELLPGTDPEVVAKRVSKALRLMLGSCESQHDCLPSSQEQRAKRQPQVT